MTFKIKPFTTEHTWEDPDNAIDFYEEQMKVKLPEPVIDFLYAAADLYPDALYNVQPAFTTNYIAIARKGDRRPWAYAKPEKLAIWVAHSRNADTLCELFPEELFHPENQSKASREFVDVPADRAAGEGAEMALAFASRFASPYDEDDLPEKFS